MNDHQADHDGEGLFSEEERVDDNGPTVTRKKREVEKEKRKEGTKYSQQAQ